MTLDQGDRQDLSDRGDRQDLRSRGSSNVAPPNTTLIKQGITEATSWPNIYVRRPNIWNNREKTEDKLVLKMLVTAYNMSISTRHSHRQSPHGVKQMPPTLYINLWLAYYMYLRDHIMPSFVQYETYNGYINIIGLAVIREKQKFSRWIFHHHIPRKK